MKKRGRGADVSVDILVSVKKVESVVSASCLVIHGNYKHAFLLNCCHVDRGHFD